jgi:hypothetical protein
VDPRRYCPLAQLDLLLQAGQAVPQMDCFEQKYFQKKGLRNEDTCVESLPNGFAKHDLNHPIPATYHDIARTATQLL